MGNLYQQSTFKKLYKSTYFFMKDKNQINDPLLCDRTNFLKEKILLNFFFIF